MAERRMFNRKILFDNCFQELPPEAQTLYFHLALNADDDGFSAGSRAVSRMLGTSAEMTQALADAGFLIVFPSGLVVIRHWRIHNSVRKDRYQPTHYQAEMAQLTLDAEGAYVLQGEKQREIEENRKTEENRENGENRKPEENRETGERQSNSAASSGAESRGMAEARDIRENSESRDATPLIPTQEEVCRYVRETGIPIDPGRFYDYYAATSWHRGGAPIRDWKAALRCWASREKDLPQGSLSSGPRKGRINPATQYSQRSYAGEEESMEQVLTRLAASRVS